MEEAPRKSNLVKNLVCIAIIAAAAIFVWYKYAQSRLVAKENAAVQLMEQDKHENALEILLPLHEKVGEASKARVGGYISDCYVALAEKPSSMGEESIKNFQEAMKYDASKVPSIIKKKLDNKTNGN